MTTTHGSHARASFRLRDPRLATLDDAIDWLREHWDGQRTAPTRLTQNDTEGELGGLRFSAPFASTLDWNPRVARRLREMQDCHHPLVKGDSLACPECAGYGVKEVSVDRYPYPMSSALARLTKVVPNRLHPHPVAIVYGLAAHGWHASTVARLFDLPWELAEALFLRAIRQLFDRYEAGPVAQNWTELSESQRQAILTGEVASVG